MFDDTIEKLKKEGLYRALASRMPGNGPEIVIDGKTYLSFSSNDYLGLSRHPRLIEAGQDALKQYGAGSGASRLLSGSFLPHLTFENEISKFKNTESALLFGSGYLANLALLSALPKEGDLVLADRLNHASLMDGCRLSRATFKLFRHRDIDHLRYLLDKKSKNQKAWIISEGVFSMEGDLADLPELVSTARQFQSELIIDDAHGFGVLGKNGRGTFEHFNLERENRIEMGTLGKAAGLYGAFVAGSKSLIDYLINRAKPFIYTTSLPPAIPAMGIVALQLLSEGEALRSRLKKNQAIFYARLLKSGFSVTEGITPIIPILTGDNFKTMEFSKALFEEGLYIPAIRPPTVPGGKGRLRISLSAAHSEADIEICVKLLTKWGKHFGII
ncbi:MAG: 8-amino-7-oxononanoate synthase [Nitrospirae bacterium]|nr:8-amino-7-oxononanoate synthase [Nitrospirota bacterium]MBI3594995.1 8-amino-7-oxononanoate synthase [Nitrospirota bacterium]